MEIREVLVDVVLTIILVVSTLTLVWRVWQDLTMAVATTLMMLSLGGLFLSLNYKIQQLDASVIARERTMRVNLEEISRTMEQKYDNTVQHIDATVNDITRRMYR
ncbi:MAG: hypothetical protein PHU26_00710 [Methanofollis liminatans]|jgi:hypothetical protein|uniref:Uncharacterized protein n=1 Tax=Methanofollis liminatans DSM 4140 TaxID=28892 RepID=J0S1T8_9EURY|nr:hypothetical protein [Methanofollis liminatans]EJG07821.1 hypothetical protein Metli_1877 [Methanofollis liminatans DSM 4140]MDD3110799.1 hypothetical protein [Methanofollis liminatans]